MKKYLSLFSLLLLMCIFDIPSVFAHEMLDDGWHLVSIQNESERGKDWLNQKKVWAYYKNGVEVKRYSMIAGAHRGWGTAPENSLASFKDTRDNGYISFETDVRFTKDNVPVLIHDESIHVLAKNNDLSEIPDRLLLNTLTYNQLKTNYVFPVERLNHNPDAVISGYETNRVTTFEQMLDFVKANGMHVSIELKEGTKEQIESIVKMARDKGMHNYVRWISYSTDLLKYVRDYDDDEYLGVLVPSEGSDCDPTLTDIYCGGDNHDYFYNKLKTSKNMVWLSNHTAEFGLPGFHVGINLPTKLSEYPADKYKLTTIPQGKITFSEETRKVETNDGEHTETVPYEYNGDGQVKCESSNPEVVTCSVDETNKAILIKAKVEQSNGESVKVYATQGINYSASADSLIQISYDDTVKVPDTGKNVPIFVYIISFIFIGTGIILIRKVCLKK